VHPFAGLINAYSISVALPLNGNCSATHTPIIVNQKRDQRQGKQLSDIKSRPDIPKKIYFFQELAFKLSATDLATVPGIHSLLKTIFQYLPPLFRCLGDINISIRVQGSDNLKSRRTPEKVS
jgi:hypothetical protein